MVLYIGQKDQDTSLNSIAGGINKILSKKVSDMQRKHQIEERKSTYRQADIPEWVAELPEDTQKMILKEWQFVPEEERQQLKEDLDRSHQEHTSKIDSMMQQVDNKPSQQQDQQSFKMPEQLQRPQQQGPEQFQQGANPTEQGIGNLLSNRQQIPGYASTKDYIHGNKLPGTNSIEKAGEGFQRETGSPREETQDFPALGHGTKGQPGPFEGTQPKEQEPKKFTAVRQGQVNTDRKQQEILRKEKLIEDKEAMKETKKYYDSVLDKSLEARESNTRLNKMERLVKKGGLPIAAFYKLFNNLEESVPPQYGAPAGAGLGAAIGGVVGSVVPGIGTAIGAGAGSAIGAGIGGLISPVATMLKYAQRVTSPNTEEFEKLSNQFIRGAKAIFGSRITDQDLKAYMATIPTLANTDSGKEAIIGDMKIVNDAEFVREKAMKQIIRENGGRRPADLAILVEERAKPELDILAKRFINL